MTKAASEDSAPTIEWYWMHHTPIRPELNRLTFPDSVFFYEILEPGATAHWSLDLVNRWTLVSRYEPRIPIPGRQPHPQSLLERKDIHHLKSTSVGSNPDGVATVPGELMEEFDGQHRGVLLTEHPEFWFKYGETCHFTASNAMILSQVMYMLKDTVGRAFVNEVIDANMDDYFTDGGRVMTDGGERDADSDLVTDETDQIIPEAITGPQEVLNLTTGDVMSFDEAEARIEEQREELEQWLDEQRQEEE